MHVSKRRLLGESKGLNNRSLCNIPQLAGFVGGSGEQLLAVRAPRTGVNGTNVSSREHRNFFAGLAVVEDDLLVRTDTDRERSVRCKSDTVYEIGVLGKTVIKLERWARVEADQHILTGSKDPVRAVGLVRNGGEAL